MEKIFSCCGVICSECTSYPETCKGCPKEKGKAYWLEYTGEDVCSIYQCCVNEKKHAHCGKCTKLPCEHFDGDDPTKSPEENAQDHLRQLENLKQWS